MEIIKNPTPEQVLAQGGYYGQKDTWNAIYVDPKTKKWLRDRSEMIIIKDGNKIFMRMHGGNKYRLPGGGKEVNKTALQQAIEETKEEARINVKNVKDTGIEWCDVYSTPGDKAHLEGDRQGKLLWYGNHTNLFIGEYDSPYTGTVKKIDSDPDLVKNGDFYPIPMVWHILKDVHKDALRKFNYYSMENIVKNIKECTNIFQLDKLKSIGNRACKGNSDVITLEHAVQDRLELFNTLIENSQLVVYPTYTPQEMRALGVFNEDSDLNCYKTISNQKAKEWFEVYEATGNPGFHYADVVAGIWREFVANPSDLNRQYLLEMGWNPEIKFNNENKSRTKQLTLEKLNDIYTTSVLDFTSINEAEDGLTHSIAEVIVPLGKEIRAYIKKLLDEDETYSEIYNGYNIQMCMAQELINNGTSFILFKYDLGDDFSNQEKDFELIRRIQELCNTYMINKGHIQYEAKLAENTEAEMLDIKVHGYLLLQQRVSTGDLNYVQESVQNELATGVVATPVVGIDQSEYYYEDKRKKGEYSGDIDLDYADSIGEQEVDGKSRNEIIKEVSSKLKELGRVEDVSRKAYLGFLMRECNHLNIYSGDDYKEICNELNTSLNSEYYTIKENSYNTLTLVMNKNNVIKENVIMETMSTAERDALKDEEFGLPEKRLYPLNTEENILQTIKWFNKCNPKDKRELARNIRDAVVSRNMQITLTKANTLSEWVDWDEDDAQWFKVAGEKTIYDESVITESKSLNRKQLLDKVKSLATKYKYTLKTSKKGEWGEEKFLTGDNNFVYLVGGAKNARNMIKDLNKELKGTGAKLQLDNYNTVFLYVSQKTPVSEDTILEAVHKDKLHPVYIVNSFTNTNFGKVITKFTGDAYSHSALALDGDLEQLYSYNAGNNRNLLGGFSIESITDYKNKSEISRIQINVLFVGDKAYKKLKEIINMLKLNISNTTYNFANLFNVVIHKQDKNQNVNNMICSQFVDNILKTVNIDLTNISSNLVTPGKLAKVEHPKVYKLYEGLLSEFSYKSFMIKVNRIMSRKIKPIAEERIGQFFELRSILEAKEFPVQFDDDGNLLIKNSKKLDYNSEWRKTKKLRKQYQQHNNIQGMKYEAAKCWYLNQCIENDLDDFKHSSYSKEDLILYRSRILTEFSQYMKSILKVQDDFNFTAYYNSTPFSDDKTEVSASTLKYGATYIKSLFKNIL